MTSRIVAGAAVLACLALAGCGAPSRPPLVSAQYPPAAVSSNAMPQVANSLPPGAANISSAPNATEDNYLSWTFGRR